MEYSKKTIWTTTKTIWVITGWSNVIITLDVIDWFKSWDSIIIDTVSWEEEVKVLSVDQVNKQITVNVANDINSGSTVIWDTQVKIWDRDIIVYYTWNITYNIVTWVPKEGWSSKWEQWKIKYEEKSNDGLSQNWYQIVLNQLLARNPYYIWQNTISFWTITLI